MCVLDEEGLIELDRLGKVTDVIRLGCLHGRDDPFYVDRYDADYWAMPGVEHETGLKTTNTLTQVGPLPISDASFFEFRTTKMPEGILRLDRAGGILIACDALQNWITPDEYFSDASRELMQEMEFFTPANLGPRLAFRLPAQREMTFLALKHYRLSTPCVAMGNPCVIPLTRNMSPRSTVYSVSEALGSGAKRGGEGATTAWI